MDRRDFLKKALAVPFAIPLLGMGQSAWCYRGSDPAKQKLVVIMLRGGVDGLNVVAPHGDRRYREIRPTIAMGKSTGLIDLDGYWGMHPALAALSPLWQNGTLSFVHACGSPDRTRSHFDAQDYMESGVPGMKSVSTGWLNRLVAQLPSKQSPLQAISLGPVLPRIFSDPATVATIAKAGGGNMKGKGRRLQRGQGTGSVPSVFADMYGGRGDDLSKAFASGNAARTKVDTIMQQEAMMPTTPNPRDAMSKEQIVANRGALTPESTPEFGKQLATLFRKDPTIQVAFMDFGGWDTHVRQGAEQGQLANRLRPLANGIYDLVYGLGDLYRDTTIVVMSEFGRTARENGNGGTDHGHGNVMWIMGGVPGKKVYGRFGGLADNQLNEARDLPTTTDFRQVLSAIMADNLSLSQRQLAQVFPNFQKSGNPFIS